jgi:hypothetical protein
MDYWHLWKSFFTCAHFCPTYGEVTLQCQDFTSMDGSGAGERGQSLENMMCIPFTEHNFILYSFVHSVGFCTHTLLFDVCFIFLIVSCLLVGSPIVDISTAIVTD